MFEEEYRYTPMLDPIDHYEADSGTKVQKRLSQFKKLLPNTGKYELAKLSTHKKSFREALRKAGKKKLAQIKSTKQIHEILEQLDEDDREAVILEKFRYKIDKVTLDVDGIQFSLRLGLYKILKVLLNKVRVRPYLGDHQLLEHAIMSKDDRKLRHIIQTYEYEDVHIILPSLSDRARHILYEESWNQDIIEALYPYTSSYFIPRGQDKAKMYAFVCYNTFDAETSIGQTKRFGAREEANRIIKGFMTCGITVKGPFIDWTFDELLQELKNLTSEVKNDCSVVFMCIMSHGDQGVIYDKDGRVGEINKILNISYLLKGFLPVVILIQACQGEREPTQHINIKYYDSPSPGDAYNQYPGTTTVPYMGYGVHISVLRPNTMVVTATAEYHKASREIFLSHFASQLEYANGITTISSMVQLCSKSMSLHMDTDSRRQAPLSYDLLRQPLVLPRAEAYNRMKLKPLHLHSGFRSAVNLVNEFRKLFTNQFKDKLKGKGKSRKQGDVSSTSVVNLAAAKQKRSGQSGAVQRLIDRSAAGCEQSPTPSLSKGKQNSHEQRVDSAKSIAPDLSAEAGNTNSPPVMEGKTNANCNTEHIQREKLAKCSNGVYQSGLQIAQNTACERYTDTVTQPTCGDTPARLDTPQTESKIWDMHDSTHKRLYDIFSESSSAYVTSTVATHLYQGKAESFLILAPDIRESIADYIDSVDGHTLIVTTTHFQSESLVKHIRDNDNIVMKPDDMPIPFLAINIPEHIPFEKHQALEYINSMQRNNDTGKEFILEISPELGVCIRIMVENREIISVEGFFDAQSPEDPFEDNVSQLTALNQPADSQDVTAVAMMWIDDTGEVQGLYKLLAGAVKDLPSPDTLDSYQLSFHQIKNDDLHNQIRKLSIEILCTRVDSEHLKTWESKSPLFVVTTAIPELSYDGSQFDLDDIVVRPKDQSLQSTPDGKAVLVFPHPASDEIEIQVQEPSSPEENKFAHPKATKTIGIERAAGRKNHPVADKKAKMSPMTRKLLEKERKSVNETIRGFHGMNGTLNDAVTAIAVTLSRRGDKLESYVVLMSGVVKPAKSYVLRGKGGTGVVISTDWLFSPSLKKSMREAWREQLPSKYQGKHAHMVITHGDLKEQLWRSYDCPSFQRNKSVLSPKSCKELTFESIDSMKYTMRLVDMGYAVEEFKFCRCTRPDNCITCESEKLDRDDFINLGEIVTGRKLDGSFVTKRENSKVTISVHYLCTSDHMAGPGKFRENVFVLVALGGEKELKIISDFIYHDPQHLWKSHTWVESNPQLVSDINEACRDDEDAADHPAKFMIYHSGSVTEAGKRITLVNKSGDVRYHDQSYILEIWAHSRKPKSIINHLLDDESFVRWFQSLDREQDISSEVEKVYDEYFAVDRLPTSAKHATIHFRLVKLARPNQMGSASLIKDSDKTGIPVDCRLKSEKTTTKPTDQAKLYKAKSRPTRISKQSYDFVPRGLHENMALAHAEQKSVLQSSVQPAQTGTRPKQDLTSVTIPPSKNEMTEVAKKLKSELLLMENNDEAHIQCSRPEAVLNDISIDYIVNELIPQIAKELED